jgi:phenylpropionate dioxygenase-like ring-hydroxylating dioxygenase large terminal subunit
VEQRDAVWGHTWYPLQFEALADKSTPSSARLLGADVVFWFDHVQGYWAAALDACPHRLVPLSEGRVCPQSGDIECPYHGWTFRGADGACTRIPQLEPGVRIKADRAQATMLPVETRAGIIWCWAARLLHSEALPDPDILDALQVNPWMDVSHMFFAHLNLFGIQDIHQRGHE